MSKILLLVFLVTGLLAHAALLTGYYRGLNPTEHTIADHLKAQGYATACFGKWHLAHHTETLPQQNGFDTDFGIPPTRTT